MGERIMKKILLVFILIAVICGCSSKSSSEKVNYKYSKDPMLESALLEGDFIIVDVRTKEEYNESHIKGAINIPYEKINEYTDLDINKNIFVYCKSGARSAIAYKTLKQLNYNVYDLGAYDSIALEKEK